MADVLGSMVVQDITYTQAHHGLAFKITYRNGGVAGAETVQVSGTELIFKIASGTSTATQVLACLNASAQAKAIVTGAISGTAGNAQKTCVLAFLSGGVFGVKAQLPIKYGMYLVANLAGTAGNSIRFRFTSGNTGGAATVTASGSDITCQIENGVTLYSTIFSAINADSDSNALVHAFCPLDLHTLTATSADMSSLTALAGGVAATSQAVVVQDLTYTNVTVGPSSQRKSVTYTIGATAGAEVVTVDANGDVSIQIQNGVSTGTDVYNAFLNSSANGTAATPSGTITYGSPSNGDTVIVTGPTGGPFTFTKASVGAPTDFSTAGELATLINAIVGLDATNASGTITLVVTQRGTAPNSWTVTGTGSYVALSRTFSGGTAGTNMTVAITGTGSNAQKTVNQLATVASEDINATTAWEYPDVYKVDVI